MQLASAHLQQNDAPGALTVLTPLVNTTQSQQGNFRYTLARAYQLTGDVTRAAPIFRAIYAAQPFTFEATQSAAQLQAMGQPVEVVVFWPSFLNSLSNSLCSRRCVSYPVGAGLLSSSGFD